MARPVFSSLEPLETRIAPAALTAVNPIADILVGFGKTSATIDVGQLMATKDASVGHTMVEFTTNFDTDPGPGVTYGKIDIELRDDVAPLTVQNFLNYVMNANARGDYNGVFFHRSITASGGSPLPILQAGGYEVTSPATHIAIGPTVHNEYSLPNVLGSIAMAKIGGNENSASSEFFFNLGDNTSALGAANNGGFTVFGQVTPDSLVVLQKIFASPTVNEASASKNSALTDVPYQGTYNSNPDQNLSTPAPALAAANYIQITSAKVLPPTNYTSDGFSFVIKDYVNHGTTTKSTLVKPTLVGDKLTLVYNAAATTGGTVDVTIQGTNAHGDTVTDTFGVTFHPNLIVTSVADAFQPLIAAGDVAKVQTVVRNNGSATLDGKYDVTYYLSAIGTNDDGTTLDAADVKIGSSTQTLKLAPGGAATIQENITVPLKLITGSPTYRIIASVTKHEGSTVTELFDNDQTLSESGGHQASNLFGSVSSNGSLLRSHPTVTYTDAAGHTVTATLTGPGFGQFTPTYDGTTLVSVNLDFFGTTAASTATLTSSSGHTALNNVRVDYNIDQGTPIGTLNLSAVDLAGSMALTGGVRTLSLGDIGDNDATTVAQHALVFGSSTALAKVLPTITLGNVEDMAVYSDVAVNSISAKSWVNANLTDPVTLPGLKSLTVTGNLQVNLDLSAKYGNSSYMSLDPATTVPLSTLKVGGTLFESEIKEAGNVGAVDLGAIDRSSLLVGTDSVPTDVSQFNYIRTIASVTVRGLATQEFSMADSEIVAATITSINLKGVLDTRAGSDTWGFVADKIGTYSRAAVAANATAGTAAWPAVTKSNLLTGDFDTRDKYSVHLL